MHDDGLSIDAAAGLGPGAPGIRLSIGMSGAGKTFGIMRDVYASALAGTPVLVIDRMREWERGDATCKTVRDAAREVDDGARVVILRPDPDRADAETHAACKWAVRRDGPGGVCIPEAHHVFPNGSRLKGDTANVVQAWRHYGVSLWVDTQRLPLLNRTITEQARDVRVYAIVGNLDLRALDEIGGDELVACVQEAAQRLARGEAGWHVRLGLVRMGPFALVRS